jgi:hypothetical protein
LSVRVSHLQRDRRRWLLNVRKVVGELDSRDGSTIVSEGAATVGPYR